MSYNLKQKIFFLILFYSVATTVLTAQIDSTVFQLQKVKFHGNQIYSNNEIQDIIHLPTKLAGSFDQLCQSAISLLQAYQKDSHYFATIDSITLIFDHANAQADVHYFIDEGFALHAHKIVINSDNLRLKSSLESLAEFPGNLPPELQLKNKFEELLVHLENNGFPFCQIEIDSFIIRKDHKVDAYISINPGPMISIDTIKIVGNKTTKNYVIQRETRIKPGAQYNQKNISKISRRLLKLGFFNQVDEPQIFVNSTGKGELLLRVAEGNMNNIDVVVGYNPGVTNQKGYFTGLINISLTNLLGTGRQIDAYWEKKDLKSQQLKFRYLEPWVGGLPVHIGGSFQQLIQDTSYVKRNWTLDVVLPVSDNVNIFSNIGNESISPDSIGAVLWNIPESKSWLFNSGVVFDSRNDQINPSRGLYYQTTFELSLKKVDPLTDEIKKESFQRKRITFDVELIIPCFRWQVVSLALHGRQISSNEPELSISDLYRFGGSSSLRGFREDEFWGSSIAWMNAEYRYLLSSRSRAFIFLDGGYFSRESNDKLSEDFKAGYGFGIRLDTRMGIIGIDYGLAKGRSLTNGLVHVRLVNKF